MESKFIKALDVDCFDHQLWVGDTIKIYGKETTITGFSAQYNDARGMWETIIHTVGRGDPFERTLSDIEVLEEQPRSYEQRAVINPAQPAVWVKCADRLPGWKKKVKWRDGNNPSHGTQGTISLYEMDNVYLDGWEWLDESAAPEAGREEEAVSKDVLDFIREIATCWDCDEDAHKYNTICRKCRPSELLYDLTRQQKEGK